MKLTPNKMKTPLFDMEELDYYRTMIPNLLTLEVDKWWNIKSDREDKELFIKAIKNRIDYNGDFEFNFDYSKFRRIKRYEECVFDGRIHIKLEFNDHLVQLPYDHLPQVELPIMDHKVWEKRKGRAV